MARAEITVFAAASLRGALEQINADFGAADVTVSYASSAALARQIQQGAPADIFISANQDWMQVLVDDDLIIQDSQITLLNNKLALVSHVHNTSFPISDLPAYLHDHHLAMGFVKAVPAGIYGKRALQNLGLWQDVLPHVVQTDNVRAALALVALQEARFGIVYASDAVAVPDVQVLHVFDQENTGRISYPAAALTNAPKALDYLAFLQAPFAQRLFEQHGFITGKVE
ncbi:MAG: molybdate ABC transporter substrate-binding protein [Cognatishimia sp.]